MGDDDIGVMLGNDDGRLLGAADVTTACDDGLLLMMLVLLGELLGTWLVMIIGDVVGYSVG